MRHRGSFLHSHMTDAPDRQDGQGDASVFIIIVYWDLAAVRLD